MKLHELLKKPAANDSNYGWPKPCNKQPGQLALEREGFTRVCVYVPKYRRNAIIFLAEGYRRLHREQQKEK